MKRELARIEEEENKAKAAVEEAIKQRNQLDDMCKKIKSKIKENREKFKNLDAEFGFVFRDDFHEEHPDRLALVVIDDPNKPRQSGMNEEMRES